jgi:hypothetical protein
VRPIVRDAVGVLQAVIAPSVLSKSAGEAR